jgi:hypothetical protein
MYPTKYVSEHSVTYIETLKYAHGSIDTVRRLQRQWRETKSANFGEKIFTNDASEGISTLNNVTSPYITFSTSTYDSNVVNAAYEVQYISFPE